MPVLDASDYKPGWPYGNTHGATVLPSLLRRVKLAEPVRERLETSDGDFIDLDCWHRPEADGTVVLCHGLEGNARRPYMLGMARAFLARGWNVVGFNYRGCSGEPNRKPWSYHSGSTGDLREVLAWSDRPDSPVRALVGFSLGGNLVLKYLGEAPDRVLAGIKAVVAVSVPADLADTARQMALPRNRLYQRRFLRKLAAKTREKSRLFPEQVDARLLSRVRTLWDFDDLFTAPLGGFAGADDYYRQCSCRQFLPRIRVPSLLLSARDDPFLGPSCYPEPEAAASEFFHLLVPERGGHVGFRLPGGEYWSEKRAVAFVTRHSDPVPGIDSSDA